MPRRDLKTCCHSNSSERPSANTDMKNSQGVEYELFEGSLFNNYDSEK